MLSWLAGCASSPLPDVPIVGGTADQRDRVRDAVIRFDAAAGTGRVELREIRIEPMEDAAGSYRSTRVVSLDPGGTTMGVVYHELCHALVDQQVLGPGAPLDRVAEELFDPDFPYNGGMDGSYRSPAARRSEAVAWLCEPGPHWAAEVERRGAEPGDDAALTEQVAAWLQDWVWSAFTAPEPLPVGTDAAIEAAVSLDGWPDHLSGTDDPDLVVVTLVSGEQWWFDARTGTQADASAPERPYTGIPGGLGMIAAPDAMAGWPDGPAAVLGQWMPMPLDGESVHLVVHDGEGWRPVVGLDPGGWVFSAADTVWYAWFDGKLRWVPLVGAAR